MEATNTKNKIIRAATNKRRREQERAELKNLRSQQTSVATTHTHTDQNSTGGNTDGRGTFKLVPLPVFSTGVDDEAPLER